MGLQLPCLGLGVCLELGSGSEKNKAERINDTAGKKETNAKCCTELQQHDTRHNIFLAVTTTP